MHALIVDDSRAMRMLIGKIVTGLHCQVSFASNGIEALRHVREVGRPNFILADWNMPEMDGFALLQAVRADPSIADLPVIMVTTETEMSQMEKALAHGANEYVMKPFTPDILRGKLDMLGLVPEAA
jgi:two-component system chemotaxis response regulator CheY